MIEHVMLYYCYHLMTMLIYHLIFYYFFHLTIVYHGILFFIYCLSFQFLPKIARRFALLSFDVDNAPHFLFSSIITFGGDNAVVVFEDRSVDESVGGPIGVC
eukprot:236328_1